MTLLAKRRSVARPPGRDAAKAVCIALAFALVACGPEVRDRVTRDAARSVVSRVVAERFPGVPLEPSVDCIIDGANSSELLSLAADAITGPTASTVEIVSRIASRPETVNCLATKGLPVFLQRAWL